MSHQSERPVCASCGKVFNEQLDDIGEWHEGLFEDDQRDREYDWLCPECHDVVVKGVPETRDCILREYPVSS